MEEIVVSSGLRDEVRDLPPGISVLDARTIERSAVQHFEELTSLVPNLNWSGEGSRARYFQIRGTGELEQYEGAPNPSVGFIVDDIDFSGLGAVATLFDVEQVEVLRGPQGTRYGANALAGLVYVRSADPGPEREAWLQATGGSDDTVALGGAVGGPMPGADERLTFRAAGQLYQSDGFRDNEWLGRDDTYQRDELTARAKLRWIPSAAWQADLATLYVDVDNGYDAFAVDNGFTTRSDRPGRDAQESAAASLRLAGAISPVFSVVSITSVARSDGLFSFDSDWGNPAFWAPYEYDYTSRTDRERTTANQEIRLVSTPQGRILGAADWLVGIYVLGLDEQNEREDRGQDSGFFCPEPCVTDIESDYDATSAAVFGEIAWPLAERLRLSAGVRAERREAEYTEAFAFRTEDFELMSEDAFSPTDRLWGGDLALTWGMTPATRWFGRVARGYKAGGFNTGLARADLGAPGAVLGPEDVLFEPEAMWSYEAGLRHDDSGGAWTAELVLFWQEREDMQVRIPFQVQPGDPNTFLFLTGNAERGRAVGAEFTGVWRPFAALSLRASAGLLDSDVRRFSLVDRLAGTPGFGDLEALPGRDFAHAPRYSFSLAADWSAPHGWFAQLALWGRDDFYFDYGHNQRSEAYQVVDLRIGRAWGPWELTGWVRNLFDEEYAVRGFYFGNEPPDFPDRLYLRLADPRHLGLTLRFRY
jgi:outer membrane receptor protein involved in Fe transport